MGDLDGQALLSGADGTQGIVCAEVREGAAVLFLRTGAELVSMPVTFKPWLLAEERHDLQGMEWQALEASGSHSQPLCWLGEAQSVAAFTSARRLLRDRHLQHFAYGSLAKQLLARSGRTLFKGMQFEGPVRLQLDLETTTLSPHEDGARVLLAALHDNRGGEAVLFGDETEILLRLVEHVRHLDPDVIEGHNLLGFDLPYLAERAAQRGVALRLGRDGSPLRFGSERSAAIGGISRPFTPARIYGRHIIDTLLAAQRFDWAKGALHSFGLKEVARLLEVEEADRIILDRSRLAEEWATNPDRVREYALQDVRETAAISRVVGATDFYLTQMVPDNYQDVAVGGTGEKVESLLIREYLRQGAALPPGQPSRPFPGGYTECRVTGILKDVSKVDVESLYPSLMLSRALAPKTDRLGIFLPMLRELTRRRLEAKARVREATGRDRAYWDGLQSSFKVLINSFYGYLAGPFHFNDYAAAEAITMSGQQVVLDIADSLEKTGSRVVEIDTDGVYFVPPPETTTEGQRERYVAEIASLLPSGIRLAYEGHFAAMVSLKMKNYVLVTQEGRRIYHGSALRSRSDEPFGREFISRALDLLLDEDPDGAGHLYRETLVALRRGQLPPEQICRRERVTEATFQGPQAKRWQSLRPYARVGEYLYVYRRSDGLLGRLEDYAGDEDRDYLCDKFHRFASRLKEAVGPRFDRLFPKPLAAAQEGEVALQGTFDF
ncbi:MAG TPA: 3'-5' exonuclease [Armatimonadota bacterium]|jgi:DNA polymerase elongation subunit (family B)